MTTTADYLGAVFDRCDDGYVVVSRIVGKYRENGKDRDKWRSASYGLAELAKAADDAAGWAGNGFHTFVRCTTVTTPPPEHKRGTAEVTEALPMLWLDLDVRGGDHKADAEQLPSRDEARVLLDKFPVPPSLVLDSGGGFYPLWLLADPVTDRTEATELLTRWRSWWVDTFTDADRHLDAGVFDLTRVLRPLGIRNPKYDGHVVGLADGDLGDPVRYEVADLLEHLPVVEVTASRYAEVPEGSADPFDVLRRIGPAGHRHVADRLAAEAGFEVVDDDHGTYRKVRLLRPSCTCHGTPDSGHSVTIGGHDGVRDFAGYAEVQSDKCCAQLVDPTTGEVTFARIEAGSYQVGRLLAVALHGGDHDAAKRSLMFAGYGITAEARRDHNEATLVRMTAEQRPEGEPVLPDGYRLWQPGDRPPRPEAADGLFYGPVGEFALAAAEHTEADPVAVFAQALVLVGAMANRNPHMLAGNDRHGATEFALIVGASSVGGKGTSYAVARGLGDAIDPVFMRSRILGGFGSGEALVAELAPEPGDDKPKDNRAVIFESEFGGLLSRNKRETSTLGEAIRNAWDGRPLANRTRGTGRLVATDYHLGAIGHVTADELRARLTDVDLFGGFVNRWLLFYAARARLLPDGGNVPAALFADYGGRIRAGLEAARSHSRPLERTAEANELWHDIYYQLDADQPAGLLGQAVSRAAPHTLRLSVMFAVADGADAIGADHVGAAHLTWRYCRASAAAVFGESAGSADADRLLSELRDAGPGGLDFTQQRDLFHKKPGRAEAARAVLERGGFAVTVAETTGGRDRHLTYAVRPIEVRP